MIELALMGFFLIVFLKIYTLIGLVIFLSLSAKGKIKNQGWSIVPRGILWCFVWPWALKSNND